MLRPSSLSCLCCFHVDQQMTNVPWVLYIVGMDGFAEKNLCVGGCYFIRVLDFLLSERGVQLQIFRKKRPLKLPNS